LHLKTDIQAVSLLGMSNRVQSHECQSTYVSEVTWQIRHLEVSRERVHAPVFRGWRHQ